MINLKSSYILIALIILGFLFSDDEIEELKLEALKIEKEIKLKDTEIRKLNNEIKLTDIEINELNTELSSIQLRISNTTKNLSIKTIEILEQQEALIHIKEDIRKSKSILLSNRTDSIYIEESIYQKKDDIYKQKSRIDSIQSIVKNIEFDLKKISKKAYQLSISSNSTWEEERHLKEMIKRLDETAKRKRKEYRKQKKELNEKKKDLENKLRGLQSDLNKKRNIIDNRKRIITDLIKNENVREHLLKNLKIDKEKLEDIISETKQEKDIKKDTILKKEKEKAQKEKEIKNIKDLVIRLINDKDQKEKRAQYLKKELEKQKKEILGNFSKMKGKLQWPVNGKVISKFGIVTNPELGTDTENIGINIECNNNSQVISVMDGIVSRITSLPTYGNTIIIDHGDGYLTVYSNIDEIFVNEEDYVASSKVIGKISKTGRSKKYLHFEVWHNTKLQNPESWLIKK